jgi:uncharacterized delta-60 repeat protein
MKSWGAGRFANASGIIGVAWLAMAVAFAAMSSGACGDVASSAADASTPDPDGGDGGVAPSDGGAPPACGPARLDPAFGDGGISEIPGLIPTTVAIDKEGRIIVAGRESSPALALVRLRPDGTLDPSFGTNGRAELPAVYDTLDAVLEAIEVQSDGSIVAAGSVPRTASDPPYVKSGLVLARYDANGGVDRAFADGGQVTTFFPEGMLATEASASWVRVLADGRIVIVARRSWYVFGGALMPYDWQTAFVRYTRDGVLDPTFALRGYLIGEPRIPSGAVLLGDGTIVVAGTRVFSDRHGTRTPPSWALSQVNPDGKGWALGPTDRAGELLGNAVLDANEKLIVAATFSDEPRGEVGFARFSTNGALETTGRTPGSTPVATLLQPDGSIVLAMTISTQTSPSDSESTVRLVRFTANGRPDPTFGPDGTVNASLRDSQRSIVARGAAARGCEVVVAGWLPPRGAAIVRFTR